MGSISNLRQRQPTRLQADIHKSGAREVAVSEYPIHWSGDTTQASWSITRLKATNPIARFESRLASTRLFLASTVRLR